MLCSITQDVEEDKITEKLIDLGLKEA